MHRRPQLLLLTFLLAVASASWALAADSLQLGSTFVGWEAVADGAAREAVLERVQPLSRSHSFRCRNPEVFVHAEAATIEEALALYAPRLRSSLTERVVEESEGLRMAIVEGPDMMFERLSVLLVRPDGAWLLVC